MSIGDLDKHWGVIYGIMKHLGIKELILDEKDFVMDASKEISMIYKRDIDSSQIKIILKEKKKK